jgi:hypothetical protein
MSRERDGRSYGLPWGDAVGPSRAHLGWGAATAGVVLKTAFFERVAECQSRGNATQMSSAYASGGTGLVALKSSDALRKG